MAVNELHDVIKKQPHIIQYPNISDCIFIKVNSTLLKNYKNLIQL